MKQIKKLNQLNLNDKVRVKTQQSRPNDFYIGFIQSIDHLNQTFKVTTAGLVKINYAVTEYDFSIVEVFPYKPKSKKQKLREELTSVNELNRQIKTANERLTSRNKSHKSTIEILNGVNKGLKCKAKDLKNDIGKMVIDYKGMQQELCNYQKKIEDFEDSDIDNYKPYPGEYEEFEVSDNPNPPTIPRQTIDMSVLVGSNIDCEWMDDKSHKPQGYGKLTEILNGVYTNEWLEEWNNCRPRFYYWHHYTSTIIGTGSPIPEGFMGQVMYATKTISPVKPLNKAKINWNKVIGFIILNKIDTFKYPWEE